MGTYTVIRVRKQQAGDGDHEHLEAVCTAAGVQYSRREVVDSINAGHVWWTVAGGHTAVIQVVDACPAAGCGTSPYLATNAASSGLDNLENLPPC